jgi:hypothetical protein
MTMHSRIFGFIAGLALAAAGCGGHGLRASNRTPDAGPDGQDGNAADALPTVQDGRPIPPDTERPGPDSGKADADSSWTLPHSGGPVWRNSTVPYCNSKDPFINDLWSDSRGVYAISSIDGSLFFNSGTGWSRVSPQPSVVEYLTGLPGGPLLLYGGEYCGVTAFDGKNESCLAAVPGVSKVFVADAQHAFAIVGSRLLTLSGSYFTPYGSIPAVPWPYAYSLWADAQVVVITAEAGKVYVFDRPATDPLVLQIPDGVAATSVWGFGRDDLWVGGEKGRLAHYDGNSWTVVQATHGNCATVSGMWGADHVLYFATDNYVGRWSDGQLDTIIEGPCSQDPESSSGTHEQVIIEKIWGNSPTEVFIGAIERKETMVNAPGGGVTSSQITPDSCGEARLYWFDGQRLGRL